MEGRKVLTIITKSCVAAGRRKENADMDMDIKQEDLREMFEVSKRELEKGFQEKDLGTIHDAAVGLAEIAYMLDFFNVEI